MAIWGLLSIRKYCFSYLGSLSRRTFVLSSRRRLRNVSSTKTASLHSKIVMSLTIYKILGAVGDADDSNQSRLLLNMIFYCWLPGFFEFTADISSPLEFLNFSASLAAVANGSASTTVINLWISCSEKTGGLPDLGRSSRDLPLR